jgi:hypothetical protein
MNHIGATPVEVWLLNGLTVRGKIMIDAGLAALIAITSPIHILHLFFGVILGLVVGVLPGLGVVQLD